MGNNSTPYKANKTNNEMQDQIKGRETLKNLKLTKIISENLSGDQEISKDAKNKDTTNVETSNYTRLTNSISATEELNLLETYERMSSELIQRNLPYAYGSDKFYKAEKSYLLFHVENIQYQSLLNQRRHVERRIVALKEQSSHSQTDL